MPYSEVDKLQHEVEKLILEINSLKRPFVLQPTAWFTMIGLVLSIFVNFSQCSEIKDQARISEMKVERADLNIAKLAVQTEQLQKKRDSLESETSRLAETRDNITEQVAVNQSRLLALEDSLKKLLQNGQNLTAGQTAAIGNIQESLERISVVNEKTTRSISGSQSVSGRTLSGKLETARQKEREGFQALLNEDLAGAAAAFQAAENAYNGYHWVYELARYLKTNRNETDPVNKQEIMRFIVKNFSKGAPPELIEELRKKVQADPS